MTYKIMRVVEYSEFFPDEKAIDIPSVLKTFKRNTLVKMASILSLHFGNMTFPNAHSTLFSKNSQKYIAYLNGCCKSYFHRIGLRKNEKVMLLTFRTSLELWRYIFSISPTEYQGTIEVEDEEFMLFKVIISLNEKIMNFVKTEEDNLSLEELLFLNSYLTNECNNFDFKSVMQPQMYYFSTLVEFVRKNEVLTKAATFLFEQWGINSWKEYWATILFLAYDTEQYRKNHLNGLPVINLDKIKDQTGLLSQTLLDSFSIDEDALIPYQDDIDNSHRKDINVDYRYFRSKPFVKLKDGSGYVVINIQFLCERLFNSLYFDFAPLINGRSGSFGWFDYNKSFIEKVLFRKTLLECFGKQTYTYPCASYIEETEECVNEPDFYARKNDNILLMECKAIKMNGDIRDKGDYGRMLKELYQKLACKTDNLDPSRKKQKKAELIGVGQLARHIDSIEEDNFQWDNLIPDEVAYYPILVFEDVRFLQPGFTKILNNWFEDVVKQIPSLELKDIACRPVMAVSINTLFLYNRLIKSRGLADLIDTFLSKEAHRDENGNFHLFPMANFDAFLNSYPYNKADAIGNKIEEWIRGK